MDGGPDSNVRAIDTQKTGLRRVKNLYRNESVSNKAIKFDNKIASGVGRRNRL
jgi:hypothetical protein